MSKRVFLTLSALTILSGQVSAEDVQALNNHRFVTHGNPGQWKASKLLGMKIYNEDNENIGQISELLLNSDGKIDAVVISGGGFLGLGKRSIAVPFSEVRSPSQGEQERKAEEAKSSKPQSEQANDSPKEGKPTGKDVGTPVFGVLKMTNDELKSAPEFKEQQ